MIQDYIMSVCLIALLVALIPSIIGKDKPALWTCVLFVTTLCVFTINLFSLKLWFSASVQVVGLGGWVTLLIQQLRRRYGITRKNKK